MGGGGGLVTKSCLTLCDPMNRGAWRSSCSPPGSSVRGESPGKNSGVGCHALLQGILPTQGSNPGLPHCRWILYHLSHQGSPRILEWVAYPFSRGSFQSRNWTGVSCITVIFFTLWATREALSSQYLPVITHIFFLVFFCFFVFCFFLVLWVHPELVCFSLSTHLSLLITSDEFSQLLFEPTFIFQEYFH